MKSVMSRGLIASMGALLLIAGLAVGSAVASNPSGDAVCSTLPCVTSGDLYTVDQNNDAMDPGFERTPASQLPSSVAWQDSGSGNAWKIISNDLIAHGGNRYASRDGNGTASTRNFGNRFLADAREGEKWAISGWFKSINANTGSFGEVLLQWLDRSGAQISTSGFSAPPTPNGGWKLVTGQAAAPALTASVRGVFVVSNHSAGTWYVDDMFVRLKTTLTGFGLNATNNQASSTLNVDTTQIQSRVTGSCANNASETAAVTKIHEDGTVDCSDFGTYPIDWTIHVPDPGVVVFDHGGLKIALVCSRQADAFGDVYYKAQAFLEASGTDAGNARVFQWDQSHHDRIEMDDLGTGTASLADVSTDGRAYGLAVGQIIYRTQTHVVTVDLSYDVNSSNCDVVGHAFVSQATPQSP